MLLLLSGIVVIGGVRYFYVGGVVGRFAAQHLLLLKEVVLVSRVRRLLAVLRPALELPLRTMVHDG